MDGHHEENRASDEQHQLPLEPVGHDRQRRTRSRRMLRIGHRHPKHRQAHAQRQQAPHGNRPGVTADGMGPTS